MDPPEVHISQVVLGPGTDYQLHESEGAHHQILGAEKSLGNRKIPMQARRTLATGDTAGPCRQQVIIQHKASFLTPLTFQVLGVASALPLQQGPCH